MSWQPVGKLVLVRLHFTGSALDLSGSDIRYNGLADVLAVGPDVTGLHVGAVVMLNGPQGIIAHKELGENVALVPSALVLAQQVDEVRES